MFKVFDDFILEDAIKEVIALILDRSHPYLQLGQEYIIFERHGWRFWWFYSWGCHQGGYSYDFWQIPLAYNLGKNISSLRDMVKVFDDSILEDAIKEVIALTFDRSHP